MCHEGVSPSHHGGTHLPSLPTPGAALARVRPAAAGRAAGIEKPCHVHLLRHTCATHLVAGGADLDVVQRMLGHQRASTSQRYTRLAPVDLKREHDRTHPAAASAEGHPAGAAPAGGEEEESP